MREYTVMILQLMIWSGYTFIAWLSKHDTALYNVLMFLIFIYVAFLIGNTIMKSARKTVLITFFSLFVYGSIHLSLSWIHIR